MATRKSSSPKKPARRAKAQPDMRSAAFGALTIGAAVAAAGAVALAFYRIVARGPREGTVPTDLMGEEHPDGSERAIPAFRPDPTAPVPKSERAALRPAPGGAEAPTLVRGQARDLERLDAAPS